MIDSLVQNVVLRALRCLDAEKAHQLTIKGLKTGLVPGLGLPKDPRLAVDLFDIHFHNPLGMAAGFDKNGEVPDALLHMGFGFTEVGTVTPLAQPGNPKPRSFRLMEDRACINRFGFNNEGHDVIYQRLAKRAHKGGIVGVNVGANKTSTDRVADYVSGIRKFADIASYFTVNISSPNTPGLRDLQAKGALHELLGAVMTTRDEMATTVGREVPVFLKIAPDVNEAGLADIAEEVLAAKVDGLIISNTTISRVGLTDTKLAQETGGMSGRPLFRKSTVVLARMRRLVGPDLPIIGVGGIDSPAAAWSKITAGANLLQIYSGLVFEGSSLLRATLLHLGIELDRHGFSSLKEASGINVDAWANEAIED